MSARRVSRMNTTSKHPQPFSQTLSITAGQPLPTALNKSISLMCGWSTLKFLAISIYTTFSLVPGSSLAAVFHVTCFSSFLLLIKIIYLSVGLGLDSQLALHCSWAPVYSYWIVCSYSGLLCTLRQFPISLTSA